MKTNLVRAALICAAIAMTSTAALAGTPISSVPVGLDHDPGGNGVPFAKATTDADGNVTFRDLAPGKYVLVIDGSRLVKAIDKITPPPKHDSGPSVSLGIGGMFGGGGSHHADRQGAGPTKGSQGGAHSGGGVGIGVAVGDINGDGRPDDAAASVYGQSVTFTATVAQLATFSSTTPYCRDTAGQGMRIRFKVPEGGGPATLTISLEPANSTINE